MKPISTKGNFFKFGFDRFKNITLLGNYFDIIIYKKCTHDKKDYYLSTTKMDRIFLNDSNTTLKNLIPLKKYKN